MRTSWPKTAGIVVRGRTFLQRDLVLVRKLIRTHPSWGRTKVSEAVCRALDWRQVNGRLKDRGCRVALLKLEALGYLQLPPKKIDRGGRPPRQEVGGEFARDKIERMPSSLELTLVDSDRKSRIWNALISRHHYLGLATPVGRLMRYLVIGDDQTLGAISFSDAAWSLTVRDRLLRVFGLPQDEIRTFVISNNRFLILPNVCIRNLASRVLALASIQIVRDWLDRYGTRPVFIETFVDPRRFEGTCYRAANWTALGSTKGFSKNGNSHRNKKAPKLLFMIGTTYNSQRFLQQSSSAGSRRVA